MKSPTTDELRRLYVNDQLTLQQIGERFGISKQAVHARLKQQEVPMRPVSRRAVTLDPEHLRALYSHEGLTINEVAQKLSVQAAAVRRNLERYEIPRRRRGARSIRYAAICDLELNGRAVLPKPAVKNIYDSFHSAANRLGIKISIKSLPDGTLRICRTA